mgnify:CR=1 FL=1
MSMTSVQQVESHGLALLDQARALAVVDTESYQRAGLLRQGIKLYLKEVAEICDPMIEVTRKARDAALKQKKDLEGPALEVDKTLMGRMVNHDQAQKARAREAELAVQRERERLEAEARATAEGERQRLEALAEEQAVAEALEAEAKGDTEAAARILATPPAPVVVVPDPIFLPSPQIEVPRAEGISTREVWSAKIVNLPALVAAVAAGHQPVVLLLGNQVALNQMARAQKGMLAIPGVEAVCEHIQPVRA